MTESRKPRSQKTRKTTRSPARGKARRSSPARKKDETPSLAARIAKLGSRNWSRLLSLFLTLFIIGMLVLAWFAHDLPDVSKLQTFEKSPGIRVYARDDSFLASYGDVVGEYIQFRDIPKNLVAAVLATEDRRFFKHSGIDFWGLARAMYANIRAGGVVQGGSTVTQQVAKNVFLSPERTLKRKFQELLLSFWLENHFTKQEIFEIYLNRVYLGAGNYGIDAAAHHYFDKSAKELNLQECALLAGLLKAPSRYAPTRDSSTSQARTKQVILNMQDAGILSEEEAATAISELPKTLKARSEKSISARYFTDWIVDEIPRTIGRVQDDLEVFTTLDPKLQKSAQETLATIIEKTGVEKDASQAALVSMETTGAVRALVGGVDYGKSQYNRATQAMRQPGSSFKLFVYLAAIEAGRTPDSWVTDQPVSYGRWHPKNYDGKYLGDIPMREAFYRSLNTVAAQLAHEVGPDKIVDMARRLGITSELKPDLSISLGTNEATLMEMTGAYAHLARLGQTVIPYGILEIRDQKNEVLYKRHGDATTGYAIRSNVARMMNDLLTDTVERGTGRRANFGRPAAGKTGTSQDFRDAWFIGFTPQYVTGVWVGNDNNSSMKKVTGGSLPAEIWRDYMKVAHVGMPVKAIPQQFEYEESGESSTKNLLPWQVESGPAGDPSSRKSRPPRGNVSVFDWFDEKTNRRPKPAPDKPSRNGPDLNQDFWDRLNAE